MQLGQPAFQFQTLRGQFLAPWQKGFAQGPQIIGLCRRCSGDESLGHGRQPLQRGVAGGKVIVRECSVHRGGSLQVAQKRR